MQNIIQTNQQLTKDHYRNKQIRNPDSQNGILYCWHYDDANCGKLEVTRAHNALPIL